MLIRKLTEALLLLAPDGGGGGVAAGEAAGETPKALTLDDVRAAVREELGGYTKKTNSELADHRRLLDRLAGKPAEGGTPQASGGQQGSATQPAGPTFEDLDAAMSVGELRASLPKAVRERIDERLKGRSFRERAAAYQVAAEAIAAAKAEGDAGSGGDADPGDATSKAGGETPEKTRPRGGRGHAPAVHQAATPRPRNLREYVELSVTDPKRKAALDADPSFDPGDLPR